MQGCQKLQARRNCVTQPGSWLVAGLVSLSGLQGFCLSTTRADGMAIPGLPLRTLPGRCNFKHLPDSGDATSDDNLACLSRDMWNRALEPIQRSNVLQSALWAASRQRDPIGGQTVGQP